MKKQVNEARTEKVKKKTKATWEKEGIKTQNRKSEKEIGARKRKRNKGQKIKRGDFFPFSF